MLKTKYLILGGGMVAGYAAKELAERGLKPGELAIVSADDACARTNVHRFQRASSQGKTMRPVSSSTPPDWYREHGIEVRLNTAIEHVDPDKKLLRSNAGEEFECEHLLLATGARPRKLDCPGNDLANVFYLRSLSDSETIRSRAQPPNTRSS